MLITPLILLAAMAQALTANVDNSRLAFTKCLRAHMSASLDAKMPEAEYEIAVKAACEPERLAFRAAVIALDRSMGDSAADAADSAEMQIEDYHANFTEKFVDYTATNTRPG